MPEFSFTVEAVRPSNGNASVVLVALSCVEGQFPKKGDDLRLVRQTARSPLTPTQTECLELLAEGKTNQEVALIRGRSAGSVGSLLSLAYARLGVPGKTQAILKAREEGWIG